MSLVYFPDFLLNFSRCEMNGEGKHFYQFKSFRLDVGERQLLDNDKIIALAPKVFDVLALLIERNGHLVEKDEILRTVWADSFVEEANIARIVHTLRKTFGEDGNGNKFIETVPTKGYRFVAKVCELSEPNLPMFQTESVNFADYVPPNNLPSELSALIGRNSEISEISEFLQQSEIRLLTVTGIGGTGKTRLAQAVAQKLLYQFMDGVFFIDLSTVRDPELVAPIIGQTLGIYEKSNNPLIEDVINSLREKKMLLVLDNFEQIIEAVPLIIRLLSNSINLKILITSRVRLNLTFEHEFVLQPLAFPIDKKLQISESEQFPAVKLFIKRAQALKKDFELTEANIESIVEICQRLDGLPLAIELAAGRIKILTPQLILSRLANNLNILSNGAKDLPERQRTMQNAIGWSYDLLSAEEKKLLNRLSVFAGSFTLDGAEAVANKNKDLSDNLFNNLALLTDKNLLTLGEQKGDELQFRILIVVREFLIEKLEESGETHKIKQRHAAFYTEFIEKAEPQLRFANGANWLQRLEREHENLRAALEWSVESEPQMALRIGGAMRDFWVRQGYLKEGIKWLKMVLEKTESDADSILGEKICRSIGYLSYRIGDYATAKEFYEKGLQLCQEINGKHSVAAALSGLGSLSYLQGDFTTARDLFSQALEIAREIDDKYQIAGKLINLGVIDSREKKYVKAQKRLDEAYQIAQQESITSIIPNYFANTGWIAFHLENYKTSHFNFLQALLLSEEICDKRIIIAALNGLAGIAVKAGEMQTAAHLWGMAERFYQETGDCIEEFERDFNHRLSNEARTKIGADIFDKELKRGRLIPLKEALKLARKIPQVKL